MVGEGANEQDKNLEGPGSLEYSNKGAATGQHPPLYGGKGVHVPAPFCSLREYKHGQTEVSRQRGKAEAVWMLSGVYEGGATVCCY